MDPGAAPSTAPADEVVAELVLSGDLDAAVSVAADLDAFALARALSLVPASDGALLVAGLDPTVAAHAVWELERDDRLETLELLPTPVVTALASELPDDGATDLLEDLADDRRREVLAGLDAGRRAGIERLLRHGDETAGSLMTTEFVSVGVGADIGAVVDTLRRHRDTGFVYYVYVLGGRGEPVGVVSLRELLVADPATPVLAVAVHDLIVVHPDADQEEVARLADRYDLLAVPVVAVDGRMLGVVTADDVLEVLSDEAEEDVERFSGLEEPESTRPRVWPLARSRTAWMVATVIVEVPVAWLFLRPLPPQVAPRLVAFVPLLVFCGSSTALAAAGVMLRRLVASQAATARLLARELQGGLLLGLIGASLIGASLFLGGQPPETVGVVAWTGALTIIASSAIGAFSPLALRALRLDPVLASGPALGLMADATALAIYLAAARLQFG